jgi:hypothetical protein
MPLLLEFAKDIFILDGPSVPFFGVPYPTRSVIIRLTSGEGCLVWSPTELSGKAAKEIKEKAGNVLFIIAPNKIHHIFLAKWAELYPNAKVLAAPGLMGRSVVKGVGIDGELNDDADPAYAEDIDQVIFRGSFFMDEVVFYHKSSRTAIFTDLIQRFPVEQATGFKGFLLKMDGLVGEKGGTPRDYRLTFLFGKKSAKKSARAILEWDAQRLIVAHGMCASEGAAGIIERALSWV